MSTPQVSGAVDLFAQGLASADQIEQGLQIQALSAGDRLVIRTTTGTYFVTVIAPTSRHVLVQGEPFFPHAAGARLEGCSVDGAFLRLGGLVVGCAIEFRTEAGLVVTSPVCSIGFVEHA